jgi:ubiquinone/menaquinone biosynthesis C-methylase UbiE
VKGWRKSAYFTYSSSYPVLRRWLLARLSTRDQSVLSIGCGSGELERDLLKMGRRVTGLDICYEMLESAQRRGVKNVVQADALRLPFAPEAFDLVIFPESIGYFGLDPVLPGVAHVLKPHGRLLVTAYSTNFASDDIYQRRSVEELTQSLNHAGFAVSDHRLLAISRSRVTEVEAEDSSQLIYMLARVEKQNSGTEPPRAGVARRTSKSKAKTSTQRTSKKTEKGNGTR